jgi:hypothetical protein
MFGYPSDEPCAVCDGHKNNQSEPRFSYTVCEDHQNVPPAYIDIVRENRRNGRPDDFGEQGIGIGGMKGD